MSDRQAKSNKENKESKTFITPNTQKINKPNKCNSENEINGCKKIKAYCGICNVFVESKNDWDKHLFSHTVNIKPTRYNSIKVDLSVTGLDSIKEKNFSKKVVKSNKIKKSVKYVTNSQTKSTISQNEILANSKNSIQSSKINKAEKKINVSDLVEIPEYKQNKSLKNWFPNSQPTEFYIKMFLESNVNNIYNIDSNKLRKLKLSIELTLMKDDQIFCIVCNEHIKDFQIYSEHLWIKKHIENFDELEKDDELFKNRPNEYSELKLGKSMIVIHESDDYLKCLACDVKIEDDSAKLQSHLQNTVHKLKCFAVKNTRNEFAERIFSLLKDNWYNIQRYWCQVCEMKTSHEIKFACHLNSTKHLKKVKMIIKQKPLDYNFCLSCCSLWYGDLDIYDNHIDNNMHKFVQSSGLCTVRQMPSFVETMLKYFDTYINSLIRSSDETAVWTCNKEQEMLKNLETILKVVFPKVKAYLFGSRIANLSFPDSDFDVFLDCGNTYNGDSVRPINNYYIMKVEHCLRKEGSWEVKEVVATSQTPIIRVLHRESCLKYDLSFTNGISVEKSIIIKYFIDAYPPCRHMILFLKKWLFHCEIYGSEHINTFAITWFVIFFLQMHSVFPSVAELVLLENRSKIIAGWETGLGQKIPVKPLDVPLKKLLIGFFIFFSEFDYKMKVICPLMGCMLNKRLFLNSEHLPNEMKLYKLYMDRNSSEYFRIDSPMCIQDPINLSQNITKGVNKTTLRSFKKYCFESAKMLVLP